MSSLNVLCAPLTRDMFAIAKFLYGYAAEMARSVCEAKTIS